MFRARFPSGPCSRRRSRDPPGSPPRKSPRPGPPRTVFLGISLRLCRSAVCAMISPVRIRPARSGSTSSEAESNEKKNLSASGAVPAGKHDRAVPRRGASGGKALGQSGTLRQPALGAARAGG